MDVSYQDLVNRGERRYEHFVGNPTIGKIMWMIRDFVQPFASEARKQKRQIRRKIKLAIGSPFI